MSVLRAFEGFIKTDDKLYLSYFFIMFLKGEIYEKKIFIAFLIIVFICRMQ